MKDNQPHAFPHPLGNALDNFIGNRTVILVTPPDQNIRLRQPGFCQTMFRLLQPSSGGRDALVFVQGCGNMLRMMKPGSVLVDIAIDQGGCIETSRPTTHQDPIYVEEGVTHYCVANMPAAYARTATQALTNVTYRYIEALADHGVMGALKRDSHLLAGLNTMGGHITCRGVAEAFGTPFVEPATALA